MPPKRRNMQRRLFEMIKIVQKKFIFLQNFFYSLQITVFDSFEKHKGTLSLEGSEGEDFAVQMFELAVCKFTSFQFPEDFEQGLFEHFCLRFI
jgi:hypothetical protein